MLNSKKPHFFEGFNPTSSSHRLKVPSKFVKHLEGQTSGTVTLVCPSGNSWHADLIQHDEGLFIYNGWEAFVRDHFLENGDSLVFRYDGDLHFTVLIFDKSSCEKEAAFNSECCHDPSRFDKRKDKKREREITSLFDNLITGVPKKMRSSQAHYECISKNNEDVASISERCEGAGFMNAKVYKDYVTLACVASQSNILGENSVATLSTESLSAPEADRIARSFTSCHPNFTKVMKGFNISGSYTLNIPSQFSTTHLPKCKVKIVLRNVKGESWTVNSVPSTKAQTSHTLCGGWLAFVRGNNINMGDVCIFELVQKCEFRVQILRVRIEALEYQNGNPYKGSSNGASRKVSGRTEKMRKVSQKVQLSDKTGIKSSSLSPKPKTSNGKSVIRKKNSSQDKQSSLAKGCISMKPAPEEKIAAESFISCFPHFVRIMKKFNISGSYTLKVPYLFSAKHLPNCKTEVILRNLRGESWTVNSITSTRVQTLHTFCGGWMAFVRGNDIQMGDICIFELIGKCEMRVHISGFGRNNEQNGNAISNEFALGPVINNRPLLLGA